MSPACWKSIWDHCSLFAADWALHSLRLVYGNYHHYAVISFFLFSAGNIQKEMMALIPTSTFPTIPTFPLGTGDIASAASRAAKRSFAAFQRRTRAASPAEHRAWLPDNTLERQPVAYSSRRGFSTVVCENLVMCTELRTILCSSGSPQQHQSDVLGWRQLVLLCGWAA